MKNTLIFTGSILTAVLLAGCATKTEEFDASNPTVSAARIHSVSTISQAECLIAARAAAMDAVKSPAYSAYLEQYRKENNGRLPLMQVSNYLKNDTNDPDLNMRLITDELTKTLRDSGKVRITLATGKNSSKTFADARDLRHDNNFNQNTVAKRGTLNAPVLSLEGAIITNIIRDGSTTVKTTSFNLKIADITTGEEIWSYNKPLGFKKSQTMFGL